MSILISKRRTKRSVLVVLVLLATVAISRAGFVSDAFPQYSELWTGRVYGNPGKDVFQKYSGEPFVGNEADQGQWRGWMKADLSGIPANSVVTGCTLYCYAYPGPSMSGRFRTQTQGGWGSEPRGGNPGAYLHQNFAGAFPNGLVVGGRYTLTLTSAQAVTEYLPDGGTPVPLTKNWVNPGATAISVLAGQVVALTLSVGFDLYDPNFCADQVNLKDLVIADVKSPCYGMTVQQVLDLANAVLGGGPGNPSLLNDVVTRINENFVDGTTDKGFLAYPRGPIFVTHAGLDPVSAGDKPLWQAITAGVPLSGSMMVAPGWVTVPLNAAGVQAVQANLQQGWVALGLTKNANDTGWAFIRGYQAHNQRPFLRVAYAAPDAGVGGIVEPEQEVPAESSVTPTVVVENEGDTEAPAEVIVTIADSTGVVYSESLEVGPIPPGGSEVVVLPEWVPDSTQGEVTVSVIVNTEGDADESDNQLVTWVKVVPEPVPPPQRRPRWGWEEVRPLPLISKSEVVTKGGWLTVDTRTGVLYAARGGKSRDFSAFDPKVGVWCRLAPIPVDVSKSSRGVADSRGHIYVARGAGTQEFWRYIISQDKWERLQDIPLGNSKKPVKSGIDLLHVKQYGLDFIYALKGPKQDFLRYNVQAGTWTVLADAPEGMKAVCKEGSWMVFDGDSFIYAHKAPTHEMWIYNIVADSWIGQVPGMPYVSPTGIFKPKQIKDGGSAVWCEGAIYALKAGNTQEFWRYDPKYRSWAEREPLPALGTTLKRKAVGPGSDFVSYPFGRALFALKGNKTREVWRYTLPPLDMQWEKPRVSGNGVSGSTGRAQVYELRVFPNPLRRGTMQLSYALPFAGRAELTVFDAAGRSVCSRSLEVERAGKLVLPASELAPGAYFLRLAGDGYKLATRIVVTD